MLNPGLVALVFGLDVNAAIDPGPRRASSELDLHGRSQSEDGSPFASPVASPVGGMLESFRVVILDRSSYQNQALRDELALRLPQVSIVSSKESASSMPRPYAWVRVRHGIQSSQVAELGIVVSDGRTYHRQVEKIGDDLNRTLASSIASLLISVERSAAVPSVGEERKELLEEFAAKESLNSSGPKTVRGDEAKKTTDVESDTPPKIPRYAGCCGASTLGLATLALAKPNYGGAFQGAGAGLHFHYRWEQGLLATIALRSIFRKVDPFTISRFQTSIRGGYVRRFRDLEFSLNGGVLIEAWWLRQSGKGLGKDDYIGSFPKKVLYGVAAGAAIGYRVPLRWPYAESFTVSAFADLSASFVYDEGFKVAGVGEQGQMKSAEPLARIGGMELNPGVALTVWFDSKTKN